MKNDFWPMAAMEAVRDIFLGGVLVVMVTALRMMGFQEDDE